MSSIATSDKRIAKNTLFLYFRTMFIMLVSLYTSRVVLRTLGEEDFGIYNVVGGVVVFLAFFNNSLSITTQRFINYEMTKDNEISLNRVFSTSINIHFFIAICIFVLAETVGLWFVSEKLTIPSDRMDATLWVYQFSVLTTLITVMSVPYNAAIIASEKMNIFAYVSIIEITLKLLIVFLLLYLPYDKLKIYAILLFLVAVIIRIIYGLYCRNKLKWSRYHFYWDKNLLKKMVGFSSWTVLGAGSHLFGSQGINVLINIFFGPLFNASRAIAMQIQQAVQTFSSNFMVAIRPQIVKSYSRKEYDSMYRLVFISSKGSYFLLFLISLPILLEIDYILKLWLGYVPEYTAIYTRLILIDILVGATISPLAAVSQASGRVRNYQLVISCCFLLVVVMTAILFKYGFASYTAFVVSIVFSAIGVFARMIELWYSVKFPIKRFCKEVLFRIFVTTLIAVIIPLFMYYQDLILNEMIQLIVISIISFLSCIVSIWIFGLDKEEKITLINIIKSKLAKS